VSKKHGKGTSAVKIKNKSSNKKGAPTQGKGNRHPQAKRKRDDYESRPQQSKVRIAN